MKLSMILQFMHASPPSILKAPKKWVSVPNPAIDTSWPLFSEYSNAFMKACETVLSNSFLPLSITQRCANWLTLRQFRVTGRNNGKVLQQEKDLKTAIWMRGEVPQEKTIV